MADRHPDERAWVRPVRRGRGRIPIGLESMHAPQRWHSVGDGVFLDFYDDFLYATPAAGLATDTYCGSWLAFLAGAGALIGHASTNVDPAVGSRALGVFLLNTGTTAGGVVSLRWSEIGHIFGWTHWRIAARIRLAQLQNAGVNEFQLDFGWADNFGGGVVEPTDGVYMRYSTASANWTCVTRTGGVQDANSPTPAVTTNYTVLELEVEENAATAWFRVDGVLIQTIAVTPSHIPDANAEVCGLGIRMLSRLGAGQKLCFVDWIRAYGEGSAAR